jgi:ABC-type multidrug transport system fused ATPase/permease subunit
MAPGRPPRKLGFQHAGVVAKTTYSFVDPLLARGAAGTIDESTAADYLPDADRAERLCAQFDAAYAAARAAPGAAAAPPASLVWRAYWALYRWRLAEHLVWCLLEVTVQVCTPLLLRQLLVWFVASAAADGGGGGAPTAGSEPWRGWLWAGLLAVASYCYVIVHHQLFFRGMRMGLDSRVQAVGAVQAKVLRLTSAGVGAVTAGKLVNLVSNDVRRFDDAATFWVFLVGGPLELVAVLVLVSLRLGFPAALAGVATLLLLIPTQAALARTIGRLRHLTAAATDERVRLTGEALGGVLACKMLAWEAPLLAALAALRAREAGFIRRMNRIRAANMALSYAITPLVSLITFATARSTADALTVPDVFYALALLSLPKLYMCDFFTHGVEATAELRVSVRRLAAVLSLPEPPAPWQEGGGEGADADVAIQVDGVGFDWGDRAWGAQRRADDAAALLAAGGDAAPAAAAAATSAATATAAPHLAGVQVIPAEGPPPPDPPSAAAELVGGGRDGSGRGGRASLDGGPLPAGPTLRALRLRVARGELVAVVGPVGAGKSSLLSALLGELQPVPVAMAVGAAAPGAGGGAPRRAVGVRGSVAYCQQVPWILGATVRDNVLFGAPYEAARYRAALAACALEEDLAAMPAGDATEIGERGISLSGGQKARLALARAAYSGAQVQLLDDPLSAVDARVGRVLFDACIGPRGVMRGAARVLVTHQRQYLPRCDRIVVVVGGEIVAEGSYEELAARGVAEVGGPAADGGWRPASAGGAEELLSGCS